MPLTPDLPMLRKVIDFIDEHPEMLDQDWWAHDTACGTQHCVAGWTVHLAGYKFDWLPDPDGGYMAEYCYDDSEKRYYVPDLAADLLGLNHLQVAHLFYGSVTRDEIEDTCKAIAASVGERWS